MGSSLSEPSPRSTWRPDAVFGFADNQIQARDLAARLGVPYEPIEVHSFPDGECKVRIKASAKRPAVYRCLNNPNAKLIELVLSAAQLRESGAAEVALIAPYLPYMRQDIAFQAGEAVSQKIIGTMLARYFDRFVAVDPHLHRTSRLEQVFLGKPSLALSGAPAIAAHVKARQLSPSAILMGPDEESAPLVKAVADLVGFAWSVCTKERKGDRDVRISLPREIKFRHLAVVIIDDVISSGATIARLASLVFEAGAQSVDVYATHALFDDRVYDELMRANISKIFSCDGVVHRTNDMPIVDVIVNGLRTWQ